MLFLRLFSVPKEDVPRASALIRIMGHFVGTPWAKASMEEVYIHINIQYWWYDMIWYTCVFYTFPFYPSWTPLFSPFHHDETKRQRKRCSSCVRWSRGGGSNTSLPPMTMLCSRDGSTNACSNRLKNTNPTWWCCCSLVPYPHPPLLVLLGSVVREGAFGYTHTLHEWGLNDDNNIL